MTLSNCVVLCSVVLLLGCNRATPSSEIVVPHFSSAPYEHLDCSQLKDKIENLNNLVQELSLQQDDRVNDSLGHTVYYGWGSGDSMGTIELAKAQGERDAVSRLYGERACVGSVIDR